MQSPETQRYMGERDIFIAELKSARKDARESLFCDENLSHYRMELAQRCLSNALGALVWMEESLKKGEIQHTYAQKIEKMREMYKRTEERLTKQKFEETAA